MRLAQNRPGILALVAVIAVLSLPLTAAQQTPTFRGAADLVTVDVILTDKTGQPIRDLTPADLALRIDDVPREIRTLQFVKFETLPPPASRPERAPKVPSLAAPPAYGSNESADAGRNVFLIFDTESIAQGDERLAREAARKFLDRLGPRDRVALVTLPAGRVEADLTTSRTRISQALNDVTGHEPPRQDVRGVWCEVLAMARQTLLGVTTVIDGLKRLDGPKTVILVSGGLPPAGFMPSNCTTVPPEELKIDPTDYQRLGEAVVAARAQLFVIQPNESPQINVRGAVRLPPDVKLAGLESMTGVSGGELFRLSGTADAAFERVANESSAYYLLGFAPAASERDGKTHAIRVEIRRPGVFLRARPSFVIAAAGAPAVTPPTPEAMLQTAADFRDLPLRVSGYTFRNSGKQPRRLIVVAESPGVSMSSASYALVDSRGKIVSQWNANADDLSKTPVITGITTPAGDFRIRVAAKDASGRAGAADFELRTDLPRAGPIEVSSLMLGQMTGADFSPRLTFGGQPTAVAYLEVYAALQGGRAAGATFESATSANGPAIATVVGKASATRDPDRWIATGTIPISTLAAGDSIVRAIITGDGSTVRVVSTLRKVGR
jgi:VWFA-related protein